MVPRGQEPVGSSEDAVFVGTREGAAWLLSTLRAEGFPARCVPAPEPCTPRKRGSVNSSYWTVVVPSDQTAAVRARVEEWKRSGDPAKVKGHLARLPLDLLRLGLLIGLIVLATWTLLGKWATAPLAPRIAACVVLAGLVGEWLRWRRRSTSRDLLAESARRLERHTDGSRH